MSSTRYKTLKVNIGGMSHSPEEKTRNLIKGFNNGTLILK